MILRNYCFQILVSFKGVCVCVRVRIGREAVQLKRISNLVITKEGKK